MIRWRARCGGRGGWPLLLAGLLLAGCTSETSGRRTLPERRCAAHAAGPAALPHRPVPAEAQARFAGLGYSPAAQRAAQAVGVAPLILALEDAPKRRGAVQGQFDLRQELAERLLQAQFDTAGTVAELDCEGERADRLRRRLQLTEQRQALRLGVAGLLLGAATSAATGGLSLAGAATASSALGIGGGLAEATAAGAALLGEAPKAKLATPRNPLAEIWNRPAQPALFPPTVWRYLNLADSSGRSQLDQLRAEWRNPDLLGAPDTAEERENAALLFGPGGAYTADLLDVRDAMLDLTEASVALLLQDLRSLLREARGRGLLGSATLQLP